MWCWSFYGLFQPQNEEQEFVVGDSSSVHGGFRNLPLTPGRQYQVTLVAVNWQDDEYKYSFVRLQHPVWTSSEASVEGSNGAVWAALLLLLLIPAVVYFICRSVVYITFVTTECQVVGNAFSCLQEVWIFFITTTAIIFFKFTLFYVQNGTKVAPHGAPDLLV